MVVLLGPVVTTTGTHVVLLIQELVLHMPEVQVLQSPELVLQTDPMSRSLQGPG